MDPGGARLRTGRSYEAVIRRLRLALENGGRPTALRFSDSVQLTASIDEIAPVMVPYARTAYGCTSTHPAVAARNSYVGLEAVARPIRLLAVRPSIAAIAVTVATQTIEGLGAGFVIETQSAWEGDIAAPFGINSRVRRFDTAFGILALASWTLPALSVMDPRALPVIMPGTTLVVTPSPQTALTAITCAFLWEEFSDLESTSPV